MEFLISTISDVICEENDGDWEKLAYADRSAPLAAANGMGLELAEFCISDNMDTSFETVLPHVEACAATVKRKTLHAPYNELYPMAIDRKVVEVARERYDMAWGYCLRFGAEKMIVHANYVEDLYWPGWFVNRHVEFWKRFLEEHCEHVTICLENMPFRRGYSLSSPAAIADLIREVNDPALAMCLDTGHANVRADWQSPAESMRAYSQTIKALHVHDNGGEHDEHLLPYCGTIDWADFSAALREVKFGGCFSLECTPSKQLPIEILEVTYPFYFHIAQTIADRIGPDQSK